RPDWVEVKRIARFEEMSRMTGRAFVKSGKRNVKHLRVARRKRETADVAFRHGATGIEVVPVRSGIGRHEQLAINGPIRVSAGRNIRRRKGDRADVRQRRTVGLPVRSGIREKPFAAPESVRTGEADVMDHRMFDELAEKYIAGVDALVGNREVLAVLSA